MPTIPTKVSNSMFKNNSSFCLFLFFEYLFGAKKAKRKGQEGFFRLLILIQPNIVSAEPTVCGKNHKLLRRS